jgi:flagellar biosynthesis anti-sigma factor FlgM
MDVNIHAVGGNLLLNRTKKPSSPDTVRPQEDAGPERLRQADLKWTSLMEEVSTMPEIDQKHVDQVAQVIQNGNYSPDSTKVAEKMIRLEQELP